MLVGLDRLPRLTTLVQTLKKCRMGLVAHPASVDKRMQHISDVLANLGILPRRIFGPEHGYGGEAQDMIGVAHAVDPTSGADIVSLYGSSFDDLIPKPEHLSDLDILVIDLCDVGSRYYTYVWTAWLTVKAALALGVRCVVLDRPNPIGGDANKLEGKTQQPGFLSFVGLAPLPVRHCLTLGEIIAELSHQHGFEVGPNAPVEIVTVTGWDRQNDAHAWDRDFVMPSPNMPTIDTALVYPGGCLLEGTNLSEGRGTTRPFEVFGAPWLNGKKLREAFLHCQLPGVTVRPLTFSPTFHKHAKTICGGVQVHITDRSNFRPYATYVALIALAAYQAPDSFRFRTERYEFVDDIPAIDLLSGSSVLRSSIEKQVPVNQIIDMICPVSTADRELHERAVKRLHICT